MIYEIGLIVYGIWCTGLGLSIAALVVALTNDN